MMYTVVLHRTDEGYSVSCPELPGCWSEGETREDAIENIRDAIQEYLAAVDDLPHTSDAGDSTRSS
ncbi:MAG TPA: type II toxin-antitoxin system HicB family antitoxin [Longimicrobium sp.]|jgi:predicted RNase H-like HicB family nuclease